MKKITLVFIILLAMAGMSRGQVIEDFESINMNLISGGPDDQSSFIVIANPDISGANSSAMVCKFLRDKDGVPWEGFYAPLIAPVDITTNKFVHVKVWKPRISPVHLKLEDGATPLEIQSINPQTVVNGWEELVFDFSSITGLYNQLLFMPDFNNPVNLTDDISIYFDDFFINNDPTLGSVALQVIEDYEHIPLNVMLGGENDLSSMTLIPNPDPSNLDLSPYVIKFLRDKDGYPWGGFWSTLPTPVDVTVNKYVHVKLWKPRISPVKFKLEGGAAGTLEIASIYPQTQTNAWEDFVFDFSGKTGTYPTISLMPDFEDPLTLTDDIEIYFDDIRVNNDPNPSVPFSQVINVDMHGAGLTPGQHVFITGDFGGVYGTWAEPGSFPGNEMFDADGDSTYSIFMNVPDATYHFKFFKGTGWDGGEWEGDPNRTLQVNGNLNITYRWGVMAPNVTINVDMHGSGLTAGQPVYFSGTFGGNYGIWNEPGTNPNNMLSDADADSIYSITLSYLGQPGTYEFKFWKGTGWDGGEWNGDPNRVFIVLGDTIADFIWGLLYTGIPVNPLANKASAYPVPFSNTLNINTLVDVKAVSITTSYGQLVARFDNLATGRTTINTSGFAGGMYFITFYDKNGSKLTRKLIKQ
jgi:hypothetical protein